MGTQLIEVLFESGGYKKILENFQNKLLENGTSLKDYERNSLNEAKISYFIKTMMNFGIDHTEASLKKEIASIGSRFHNLFDYGRLILSGPKIYNLFLEKLTNRGNYTSLGALKLDLTFEIFIPLYKYIKHRSNLNLAETFCLIHGLLLEKSVDLENFQNHFEIEDSSGFFESLSFLDLSPFREKLERQEKQYLENLDKNNLLDVIKTKYQIDEVNLKSITETLLPMQRIFSPIGSIERIINTIKIKKTEIDDHQEYQIHKSIVSIIRAIYELHAKELVGKNKNFDHFLSDIAEQFSDLIEKSKQTLFDILYSKVHENLSSDPISTISDLLKSELINSIKNQSEMNEDVVLT